MEALFGFVWHDVVLKEIFIDRYDPGNNDTVRFLVEWSDWEPKPEEARSIVEFKDCYRLETNMNFGIVAQDSIRELRREPDNPMLSKLRNTFGVEDLHSVVFEMNSTGSEIRVIASSVLIIPEPRLSTSI